MRKSGIGPGEEEDGGGGGGMGGWEDCGLGCPVRGYSQGKQSCSEATWPVPLFHLSLKGPVCLSLVSALDWRLSPREGSSGQGQLFPGLRFTSYPEVQGLTHQSGRTLRHSVLSKLPVVLGCPSVKLSGQGLWLWAGTPISLNWPSYLSKTSATCMGMEQVC